MKSIHLRQTLPQVFADRNSITSDIWHKNVVFSKGEMYLIEAASGTGKSSLCSYIYGYRNDYQGIINFDETNIKAYSVEQWVNLRKHSLSMLFQDLRLFTELTTPGGLYPGALPAFRLYLSGRANQSFGRL